MSRPALVLLSFACAASAPVHAVAQLVGVEEAMLVAGDAPAGDRFGYSLALSADGDRALVGVWQDDAPLASHVGSARVLVRTAAGWAVEATLRPSDGSAMDGFGGAVALSADGSRALVGVPQDDTAGGQDAGSVRVFVRSGSTWSEEATLLAPDGASFDDFGNAVALTADGSLALVGAPYDDVSGATDAGSAHWFSRSGASWTYETRLASGVHGSDRVGQSVALVADGTRALVGAPGEDGAAHAAGRAHVFSRAGTGWTEEAILAASDGGVNDWLGTAVALGSDGSRALVGVPQDDTVGGVDAGSARVFARVGTTWTEETTLLAPDGAAGDAFGVSVASSADGTHALVGANADDLTAAADAGSAYVFAATGTTWSAEGFLTAPDPTEGDALGQVVALDADGGEAFVGVFADHHRGPYAGRIHVFTRDVATWSHETSLDEPDGFVGEIGRSVSISADGTRALVGAPVDATLGGVDTGSARVYVRTGTSWVAEATLRGLDAGSDDNAGASVSLSADGTRALVGAPGYHSVTGPPDTHPGNARVFVRTGGTWTEEATLSAFDAVAGEMFGASVALSADGNWAIVGVPRDAMGFVEAVGSARVFGRTGSTWTEVATLLTAGGVLASFFGTAVAISDDGSRAVVSGCRGAALVVVYARTGTGWTQEAVLPLTLSDVASGSGLALALTADGSRALVGAAWEDTPEAQQAGSIHPFTRTGTVWTAQAPLVAADGVFRGLLGASVAVSADGTRALAGAPGDPTPSGMYEGGSARLYLWDGSAWIEDARVRSLDLVETDAFGSAVALDATGARALVSVISDEVPLAGAGSVRVFSFVDAGPHVDGGGAEDAGVAPDAGGVVAGDASFVLPDGSAAPDAGAPTSSGTCAAGPARASAGSVARSVVVLLAASIVLRLARRRRQPRAIAER